MTSYTPSMSRVVRTACTYDCPDACGLLATVEGDQVLRLQGDPEHPVTRGRRCFRIHGQPARLRHPSRLTAPLLRSGETWREVSLDEALDRCAAHLQQALHEAGPPSVLHIGGGGSLGLSHELVGHFFRSLGPITTVSGGICGEAGEAAQREDFGDCACHDYTDLQHSAAVVLWGKNPVASGVHLVPFVDEARRRGAPVWLIDPAPAETGRLARHVVRVAPGGDGALALGVLCRLQQQGALDHEAWARVDNVDAVRELLQGLDPAACAHLAGVESAQVDALARLYGMRPVATWIGWGLQRSAAGGHAVRCIDALCLLSGQVGIAGGGANYTSRRSRGLDRSMIAPATGRTVAAHALGQELDRLEEPALRFVYINGANPVTQHADSSATRRALEHPGRFVVVADAFFTDTARAADLVLPVSLMLEDEDDVVGAYQHHHVARVRRVVAPPAGVHDDLWIVQQLGRRLGRAEDPVLLQPAATVERMTATWFSDPRASWARNPAQEPIPFAHRFPTSSGKARLVTTPPTMPAADPEYPLTFLTLSSRRWQTSLLTPEQQQGPAHCRVHPTAPGLQGMTTGDRARLVSPLGALVVELQLDPQLHPTACVVHRGGWVAYGHGVNLLVSARSTDLGQGTAFYSQRVRLEPVE